MLVLAVFFLTKQVEQAEEFGGILAEKLCIVLEKGGKELSDTAFGFAKNL